MRVDFWALTLGTIGVVYGDIGTSPLYAVRKSVLAARGASETASAEIILGILSLIIWALILVVTVKYVLLLLRADNDGEGGTLALMALAQRAVGGRSLLVLSLGIIGAALFYGDAMLTPAVSVLSAVEGLEIAAPGLQFYVVPLTVLILVALFAVQSRGTASVAAFFGPITLIWFVAIAAAGLWHISQNITVLQAISPVYGISFLTSHGLIGLLTLGRCFSPSPVLKPSTPTLGISAEGQFRPPGLLSLCPRSRSTIWARARSCYSVRRHSKTPSFCFFLFHAENRVGNPRPGAVSSWRVSLIP